MSGDVGLLSRPGGWDPASQQVASLGSAGRTLRLSSAVGLIGVGAASVVLATQWPLIASDPVLVVVTMAVCGSFVATGLALTVGSREKTTGTCLVVAGAAFATSGFDVWAGYWPQVGYFFSTCYTLPIAYGVLRYRSDALTGPQRTWMVAAVIGIPLGTVGQIVLARPEWTKHSAETQWFTIYADYAVYSAYVAALGVYWLALAVSVVVLLFLRTRTGNEFDRKALRPLAVGASALGMLTFITGTLQVDPTIPMTVNDGDKLNGAILLVFLAALLVTLIYRLHLQSTMIAKLPDIATPESVVAFLRGALDDATATIDYWDESVGAFMSTDSRAGAVRVAGIGAETVTDGSGRPVALIRAASAALRNWRRVDELRAVGYGAIKSAQLQANLQQRITELSRARERAVREREEAAHVIQRNLHDHVQQTLAGTRLQVSLLIASVSSDGHVQEQLRRVHGNLDKALEQVHDIAYGVRPSDLHGGLENALVNNAANLGLHAEISVIARSIGDLDETLLAVGTELLVNIHKHAQCQRVQLRVTDIGPVRLEVTDDGVGGASLEPGRGLSGLRDRVTESGGSLAVHSPPGYGTKVTATWPQR